MRISSIINFIRTQPEKIVFFICLIGLIIIFINYQSGNTDAPGTAEINKKIVDLRNAIKDNPPQPLAAPEYVNKIKDIWEKVASPAEGKNWAMYRQPVVAVRFEKEAVVAIITRTNLPPMLKNVGLTKEEHPDKAIINWSANVSSTGQVKTYKIYRRSGEDKAFALVIEIDTASVTPTSTGYIYQDNGLKSEMEYFYYVTATSDDKNVDKKESDASAQARVVTPIDYKIHFVSVVEVDRIYTTISKYLNGKWERLSYNVKKGENIGKDKFQTGCVLSDIKLDEKDEIGPDGKPFKRKIYKIIYLDKGNEKYYELPR